MDAEQERPTLGVVDMDLCDCCQPERNRYRRSKEVNQPLTGQELGALLAQYTSQGHGSYAVREQRDRKPPDRQCGEENVSKGDVGPLMYTPIAGVRCSECKSNDIIAVDENGGVSFHCVICDRQVGHLESSPEVNEQ